MEARLANGAVLAGFAVNESKGQVRAQPGETLRLRLFWRVEATPDRDYTVFVHLLDTAGQLAGQGDNPPLGNSWPTGRWRPGDLVPDYYMVALSPELPAGEYVLSVGMYDPATGQRVNVAGEGADVAAQRIVLPITVQILHQ
jgi:hypothetical protein